LLVENESRGQDFNDLDIECVFISGHAQCRPAELNAAVATGVLRREARRTERLLLLGALAVAESAAFERPLTGASDFSSSLVEKREARRRLMLLRLNESRFFENVSCAYQVKWDIKRNGFAGIEALARWIDPDLGPVSPGEFLPLVESEAGLAERFGEWVLLTACRQRLDWCGLIPADARVAVNLSATELNSGNVAEKVRRCLATVGLPAGLLEVEFAESAAIADLAISVEQFHALRSEGVEIAIDDFGVGFSSLSHLAELPANSLKIDPSFIRSIEAGARRADLLRAICDLGHAMRMRVVVEGVESMRTVSWLRTIGCDIVQGFAIGRPLDSAAFLQWYRAGRLSIAATLDEAGASQDLEGELWRSRGA
jgi:EAL domain-containing protein (putative c-di-GMP-specific phosphodiesterase class I)